MSAKEASGGSEAGDPVAKSTRKRINLEALGRQVAISHLLVLHLSPAPTRDIRS